MNSETTITILKLISSFGNYRKQLLTYKILHHNHDIAFCFIDNNRMNKLSNKLMQLNQTDNLYNLSYHCYLLN